MDLDPILLSFVSVCIYFAVLYFILHSMPPKSHKKAEACDVEVTREEREESELSDDTATASVASNLTVTSDHLEHILEANQRSIATLIAAMPSAPLSRSSDTGSTHIKPPS